MIAKPKDILTSRSTSEGTTTDAWSASQPRIESANAPKRSSSHRLRVALIGSYVPRKCGIATFTHDVFQSLKKLDSIQKVDVFAMGDGGCYEYPQEVRGEIQPSAKSFHQVAATINSNHYDVLFVQHEFGLFGGDAGDLLFELLDRVSLPVVTMLHTVLCKPNDDQSRVIKRLSERSATLVTMSERGKAFLQQSYGIDEGRVEVVPHGIPDTLPRDLDKNKRGFGLSGQLVAMTFGLIGPGKGLEYAIDAMPEIIRHHPNFIYVLLGATHPNLVKEQGERYRDELRSQAERLGVSDHLRFENRFVSLTELTRWIGASDIYITPYLNEAQITSGTLSYAYGCGTPVVSTPYWHATDLLAEGRGCLVPFRDSSAIAREVIQLLGDEERRTEMAQRAYQHGRTMVWPAVAKQLAQLLGKSVISTSLETAKKLPVVPMPQGEINLQHLYCLTDDTGIIQHATCALPNRHEGYCVDDNSRALLLTILLDQLGCEQANLGRVQSRYAEFVNHAIDEPSGRVRNFMSYSRQWLESIGADDSIGRTSWVLGSCVGRSLQQGIRLWAKRMYLPVLRQVTAASSLRAWCFGLLGICEYRSHDPNQSEINECGRDLLARIAFRRSESKTLDWPWFEDRLTYDNAKLPHALLAGARSFDEPRLVEDALSSLTWLCQVQTAPDGCFLPIGSDGFYIRGQQRSHFDQQPLEAWATTSACLAAHAATGNEKWFREAKNAYDWFLGRNSGGVIMTDLTTGGCFDGLHSDRINLNQGAESTLSWLLADAEMRLAQGSC